LGTSDWLALIAEIASVATILLCFWRERETASRDVIRRQVIARDTPVRRVFDAVLATAALTIASPFVGLAVLYLKLVLRGPALAHEERVGSGGGTFRLIRLRTTGGARILDILGIAAIPEFVNVLRGQMSIVGPRPSPLADAAWYTPSEARLLAVRPGIISPAWRVRRRPAGIAAANRPDQQELVAGDRLIELHYIQHRTVATDAWIIARATGWLLIRPMGMLVPVAWRVLPWVIADSFIAAASFFIDYFLRFLDSTRPYGTASSGVVLRAVAFTSVGFALVNLCFRLHRRAWRYAAGVEVLPIAVAVLLSAAAATLRGRPRPSGGNPSRSA
jgi:lipopolysaccharide/colanic/teichoic acid biosynthesis glycosyltransferase